MHQQSRFHCNRDLFLSLASVLVGFGVLMVHSASITSWPTEFEQVYLSRHVIFLSVGVIAATCCALLPARFWYRSSPYLLLATILLLAIVLVPGIGTKVKGAQRWLRYGPLSLQPSELAKLALPLYLCRLAARNRFALNRLQEARSVRASGGDQNKPALSWLVGRRDRLYHWIGGLGPVLMPIGAVCILVMLEPDLGTAIFLAVVCGLTLFIGGWPLRHFALTAAIMVPVCGGLVAMKPYQLKRLTGFVETWSNPDQAPYQLKQSMVSLGAGGLYGVGLGKGWQKLSFLPEANTDFVFAVVGEELGLVGTLSLLAVWLGLYITGLRLLGKRSRYGYSFLAGFILLTQLVLQAAFNAAVVTAMVPPKGISFPLLSYGGSNLVISLVMLGIVISLSRSEVGDDGSVGEMQIGDDSMMEGPARCAPLDTIVRPTH